MNKNISLSELICTRISHDLIGNIGAVANAVELLEEGDMDFLPEIQSILKVSSGVLTARMKFFRMAFGLNNANLQDVDLVQKTICEYLKTIGNQNFLIDFEAANISQKYCRILMLAVMALADTIIKGGKICAEEKNNKLFVNISEVSKVSAPKQTELLAILSGQEEEYLAQHAPVLYLKYIIETSDLHLRISEGNVFGFVID